MDIETETLGLDGTDEIIFSRSFIVYENRLSIDFLGKKFIFVFEKTELVQDQKDIAITWTENEASIVFANKFRNSLGSGTTSKMPLLKTGDGKSILLSIFGQQFGGDGLHITVNFYLK